MTETARNRGIARALAVSTSREALLAMAVLLAQIVAIFAYLATTETVVLSVRETLYPVVWITVSVYLVTSLWRRGPGIRSSTVALAAGVGYFLLLAGIAGLLQPGPMLGGHHGATGVATFWASPGWGPVVAVGTGPVLVTVIPFKMIGYAALAYGVGAAVAASSRGSLAGIVGLFSCVGCVLPVVAAAGGLFGSAGAVAAAATGSYDIGTGLFVLTVGLLLAGVPMRDADSTAA
jgi:hypothetical protein